jgi:hypothetical protein
MTRNELLEFVGTTATGFGIPGVVPHLFRLFSRL